MILRNSPIEKLAFLSILCLAAMIIISCGSGVSNAKVENEKEKDLSDNKKVLPPDKRPLAVDHGKIFEKDGRRYLWGGENENEHFDITNCTLKEIQFHYGIGREKFPALLKPDFISVTEADPFYADNSRFLVLKMDGIIKAYSLKDLTEHEVVNDEINGKPVMAVYCILADLGAIYDRNIGGKPFTFGLSGYTYYDPDVWEGMDGFVLWDRETESLWWPLIGQSVSGDMKGSQMKVLDEKFWDQTYWKDVKANYPEAMILASGQDFKRPDAWTKYKNVKPAFAEGKSVAPKWGENAPKQKKMDR